MPNAQMEKNPIANQKSDTAVGHPGIGAAIGGTLGLGAGALIGDNFKDNNKHNTNSSSRSTRIRPNSSAKNVNSKRIVGALARFLVSRRPSGSPQGANHQSDTGALFRTSDGGLTWKRVDMGVQPKSTIFGLAFDKRNPKRMYCSTLGGYVFGSQDSGNTWKRYPLPEGAAQVYGSACS